MIAVVETQGCHPYVRVHEEGQGKSRSCMVCMDKLKGNPDQQRFVLESVIGAE